MTPMMHKSALTTAAFFGLSLAAFAQTKVTYADQISPIFRNACTNCHNPDKKKAGLDLTTYQATIAGSENGPVIKPGNADGSLIYKVCKPDGDPKMPPKGDALSEGDMALLKAWIAGFALENANSKPATVSANKVDVAVVSLAKPDGPPPMPGDLPMEPFVKSRANNAIIAMAARPWAPLVAIGGQRQVLLYNTETLDRVGVLAFPEGFPNTLRFSRNAKLLIAGGGLGGKLGKVVMWDVATGERIGTVGNEADSVLAADISPDQQFVALGGPNKQVKIFNTKDGKQTGLIKKHTEWITAIAYSPDGKYLATADRNGGVEVWESGAEPKPFNTLAGHKVACTALAFMPGVLASASEDGKIALWNVKEGTEIRSWAAQVERRVARLRHARRRPRGRRVRHPHARRPHRELRTRQDRKGVGCDGKADHRDGGIRRSRAALHLEQRPYHCLRLDRRHPRVFDRRQEARHAERKPGGHRRAARAVREDAHRRAGCAAEFAEGRGRR